jgi:hypothetical protein
MLESGPAHFRVLWGRQVMKTIKPVGQDDHGRHVDGRHVGYEGSHVMLPLVILSLMALALYLGVKRVDISELGRSALFYVVMVFVALGIAGLFGVVGGWLRSRTTDAAPEGFCFVGALIGAVVFYIALLS